MRVRRCRTFVLASTPFSLGIFIALLRLARTAVVHLHQAHAVIGEMVWLTCRLRRAPYIAHFHLDIDPTGPAGVLLPAYKALFGDWCCAVRLGWSCSTTT